MCSVSVVVVSVYTKSEVAKLESRFQSDWAGNSAEKLHPAIVVARDALCIQLPVAYLLAAMDALLLCQSICIHWSGEMALPFAKLRLLLRCCSMVSMSQHRL